MIKDCILIQQFTGKTYTYRAVNHLNGKQQYLFYKKSPVTKENHGDIAGQMMVLPFFNVDYPKDGPAMVEHIFRKVFPSYGYTVRDEQINLAKHMYETLCNGKISLSDVPVGLGKTHAYLVATIVYKLFHKTESLKPVIISTSSIELQRAVMKDYIPEISKMLMAHGIINSPVTCVLRKGKENYLCDHRLNDYVSTLDPDKKKNSEYLALTELVESQEIDLDEVKGISNYDKRKICVNNNSCMTCKKQSRCRYQKYMKQAKRIGYDFQICNHNYFLADVLRRKRGLSALFPDYTHAIIDEAHKLKDAANQMYGTSVRQDEDTEKYKTIITQRARVFLNRVVVNLEEILRLLPEKDRKLVADIKRNIRQMKIFNCSDIIYWLEEPFSKGQTTLASVPITLSKELGQDLWTNDISFLLTSETIAVDRDFNYAKNELGMKQVHKDRIIEISKGTPFNFKENCLLYVAENMEYPDYDNPKYIASITDEAERLIRTSNGHALVLFTSDKPLRLVYQNLNERITDIPLFQMTRGRSDALNAFRASGKGVLFATGSMWEGVNIPGGYLISFNYCKITISNA
ncbi:ATP-dependent DNA helicase [Anaerovirgula multivorans]|nr:ATP-dependent DNA helicase [Anaerovirgula multivorans]